MNKKHFRLCLVASACVSLMSTALAQTTPAPAPAAAPASSYKLESSTLKAPDTTGQQVTAAPYALSGTSISGASQSSETILSAPIPENAAAYKTESGIYLYPTAFVGFGYNDNIQLAPNNTIGSSFMTLAPQLVAELKHKGDRYTAVAAVNRTTFSNSSPDNTTTSELEVAGDNYFSARARAGWAVGLVHGADERGTYNRPASENPDRWHTTSLNGRFIYGAPEAQGRLELDLGRQDKKYDNNHDNTATGELTTNTIAGRLFYRMGSRSLALVEVSQSTADYRSALSLDDSTARSYYLGYTWDATAATTGIVKVGRTTKDMDVAGRAGYSGSSWEAAVRWMPRTYSVFELQTTRATSESTGVGTYDLNTTTSLNWRHSWTNSLRSDAEVSTLSRKYGDSARSDRANTFSLAVDYTLLRWLTIGVDMAHTNYSSSDPTAEYKRNVVMFTLSATL
ncbi:MAG: outer membrane beta-barrel protein [Rhodoferax sp.]|nr:outer membrane beta-barrel protein [Rhodoferax sp.]